MLLFAAPFAEYIIPGGDIYFAGAVGITAFTGALLETKYRQNSLAITKVDALLFVCLIYAAARMPQPIDTELCIKLISVLGVWCYGRLHATPEFQHTVVWWMIAAGVGQAVIGCLQGIGTLESFHSEFIATGTFGNPGPFGGYLAVVATLLLPYMLQRKHTIVMRGFLVLCLIVMMTALVLSDSRSAWCATGIAILLFFYLKYPLKKRSVKIGGIALLVIGIPIAVMFLYSYRPGSADARIQIWRVCGEIITQSPLTGVGTGRFAANYMPAQAQYLTAATEAARHRAADNLYSYNETLTILCEQGVIGLLLVATLVVWIIRGLKSSFQSNGKAVFLFPITALLVFAQFSYPLSIWSMVGLFSLMSAVGLERGEDIHWKISTSLNVACCVLLIVGLGFRWRAQAWINDYGVFATSSARPGRIADWTIRHDPFLLGCCADVAFLRTDYEMALKYMNDLNRYAPTAQLSVRQGECYEAMGDTLKALDSYKTASRMVPRLMYPVFAEFNIYRKGNQKGKALSLARKIIAFSPKIENRRTKQMRQEALRYIQNESE